MSIWQKIEDFFTNEVEPALAGFFNTAENDLIDALTPIASQAVQELSTALSQSAGKPAAFASAAGQVLSSLATKAEAAGIEATGAAILQTATAAIAAIQPPKVTATVTPPPAA
jgi:hypothetical protein